MYRDTGGLIARNAGVCLPGIETTDRPEAPNLRPVCVLSQKINDLLNWLFALFFASGLYSKHGQNRWTMIAASARVASPLGTSLPSFPLMTPFMTIQCIASSAQPETSEASG